MKKSIVIIFGLLTNLNTFADSGCMSLAKTSWSGQVKLINKQIVKINNIKIDSVESQGSFYNLKGSIDGQPMNGFFGCIEDEPGKISSISFDSDASSIASMSFAPNNQNPTRMNSLSGRFNDQFIDTTTDAAKNFLQKN